MYSPPNPLCPLGSAADRQSQTPNGSSIVGMEAPKPLLRSRLPAPRLGADEPARPLTEGRPDTRAEAEVGKLVARLQDGGVKQANKAANGVVASPALRTAMLQARRPAPRPGIYGREGERGPTVCAGSQLRRGRRRASPPRCASCTRGCTSQGRWWASCLMSSDVAQQERVGDQNSLRHRHGPVA